MRARVCEFLIIPYNTKLGEGTLLALFSHLISVKSPSPDDHVTLAFAGLTADARVNYRRS